jgi:hypothetical protein
VILQAPAPPKTARVVPAPPAPKAPPVALGDFFAPRPAPARAAPARRAGEEQPAWGGARSAAPAAAATAQAPSFRDIQDQESDFKLRRDKAAGLGGGSRRKWFVEQRERAASIHDIQRSDEEERERREFVEDQFRIERQIREEVDARKRAEEEEAGKSQGRARSRRAKQSPKAVPAKPSEQR